MFNSLFGRLFGALWLLSAGTLLLAGLYINWSMEEEFTEFISRVDQAEREQLVDAVADIYAERTNGRQNLMPLNHLARSQNVMIVVEDLVGNILHVTHTPQMRGGRERPDDPPEDMPGETIHSLQVDGSKKGQVTIIPLDRQKETEFFTPAELDFQAQVARSILLGGVVSLLLAAVISAAVSHSISRPVDNLKVSARQLKDGKFPAKSATSGPREIQELATSFNDMAANLEKASYLKKKLSQDISHELRNPVASLKGYLEAFEDGVLPADREQVGYTLQELKRLEDLIEDLYRLSLIDFQGGDVVDRHEVDLNELGKKIATAARPLVEKNGINFMCQFAEEEILIYGDEKLLFAAGKNLIHNALDYTDRGGTIELTVARRASKQNEEQAVMEVADTGQGIPAAELNYIFERFYRADDSRDRQTGGSGLGLALVQEWTHAMGGEVQVESTPGEGSTFRLTFIPQSNCSS